MSDEKNNSITEKRNKRLIKNSFILGFGTLIPKIIAILVLPILTTYLTTEEYGNYDLILSATSLIVPVITLQIQQAVFRFLLASSDTSEKEEYISTSLTYIIVASIITIPITLATGFLLELDLVVNAAMCVLVAGESLYLLLGQVLRGIGKNINYSLGVIVYACVNAVLLIILVLVMRMGLLGVVIATSAAYAISAVAMLFIVLREYKIGKVHRKLGVLKQLLAFSAPIVPSSISLWVVNLSDRLIIVYYLGAAANGIYSVANKIPALYSTAYNIFNLSWTEMAAQVADAEKKPEVYYSELFEKLFSFLIGVMLVIIAGSPLFYKIFVNEQYYLSYYQTAILFFGVFFNSLVMYYAGIYIALKKTKQVGYSSLVGAVLNAVINLALVSRIGLYAASISTMVSYLIIALYRAIDINRFIKIKYNFLQIIGGFCLMAISSIAYYQRNWLGYIVCILIAFSYNWFNNRYMILCVINKLHRKTTGVK
ncbi:MAG: hypothetical protein EOM34_13730 [Clostridia bacterium]|nr:hypothetical protein [Clostridia bacterium]NCD03637.1 hypothetical protein [Clostridia bacterium]